MTNDDTVTLGLNGLATDAFDSEFDIIAPDLEAGEVAYWTGSEFNLNKDIESSAPEQFWDLFVRAESTTDRLAILNASDTIFEKLYYKYFRKNESN